jgi:hypothetical protein
VVVVPHVRVTVWEPAETGTVVTCIAAEPLFCVTVTADPLSIEYVKFGRVPPLTV